MLTNNEIAQELREVAAVFEVIDADFFRVRAYQNAANSIENLTISVRDLWEQQKLSEIPGVGANLSQHLDELMKTGKVKYFETEKKRVPAGMFGLLGIRGLGPKLSFKIAKEFGLKDRKTARVKLEKLIAARKLENLPGFGPKLQQKIKTSVESNFAKKKRLLISEALEVANRFVSYLIADKHTIHAEPLGSLRRHNATVGDVDLSVCTVSLKETTKVIVGYPEVNKVISSGPTTTRIQLKSGHEVDIKLAKPAEWGSLLQHYTGSKLHNVLLRTYALEKGFSLSEHGIKTKTGIYHAESEEAFYKKLGLPYIPPELREGEEEIKLAKEGQLPILVTESQIKGDLHVHTDFSFATSHDLGHSSVFSLLQMASSLGYEYLGLTDHNPKTKGLTKKDREKIIVSRKNYISTQYKEYENSVKTKPPKLFVGLEVDIKPDGELALEDDLLNLLDYAIVSVHSSFELSKADNTKRILKALNHPKVKILGHPTSRLINERPGIEADWLEIFKFCVANSKFVEINAAPSRQDLPDDLVKMAVKAGAMITINSDTHEVNQLKNMKYGVWVARRGWCQAKDILNTLSAVDLQRLLE